MSLSEVDFLHYNSHILIPEIGDVGQEKFNNATVMIIGLGGLGCPVAAYLAASGIGRIGLCDFDSVEKTNLQRQLLFSENDINKPKVQVIKKQIGKINKRILVDAHNKKFQDLMVDADYDIFIDCTDNMDTKLFINDFCYRAKKKLITGSATRLEGQIIGFDFEKNSKCCLECIFDKSGASQFNCSDLGILVSLLGMMGCLQVTMTLNMILGNFKKHGIISRFDSFESQWIELRPSNRVNCRICDLLKQEGSKFVQHK